MTVWLFTHLLPELGQAFMLRPEEELHSVGLYSGLLLPPHPLVNVMRWLHGWQHI